MTVKQTELVEYLNTLLNINQFSDYGPNGLQIEGNEEITRVAFAVSATRDSIARAIDQNAQALVVHHGLFWNFHGSRCITGPFGIRVKQLIRQNLNLLGYHLPLDAHAVVGNAAQLANRLGLIQQKPFGDYKGSPTGVSGALKIPATATQIQEKLVQILDHPVIVASPDPDFLIQRIGIITGGANSGWQTAVKEGIEAYITGEISEHDWHDSQEAGIHMFAGGHHATEQFGIQALMENIRQHLQLECVYIPSENPA